MPTKAAYVAQAVDFVGRLWYHVASKVQSWHR